jgi:hypothetical protein
MVVTLGIRRDRKTPPRDPTRPQDRSARGAESLARTLVPRDERPRSATSALPRDPAAPSSRVLPPVLPGPRASGASSARVDLRVHRPHAACGVWPGRVTQTGRFCASGAGRVVQAGGQGAEPTAHVELSAPLLALGP